MKIMNERKDIRGTININIYEDEVYDGINTRIDLTNAWGNMEIKKNAYACQVNAAFQLLDVTRSKSTLF